MKISVVIPVYNEVDSLRELHHQLTQSLSPFESYEILFIDDGSSDGSVDLIKRMSETDDHINLIQFHRNYGKSAALAEGFKYAEGDYIVTMDADLQDDPAEIPNFV
ncbi:MAG: glycosyltransferase, partial [Candidatus Marinimicrobia bacterium]|nr:glycosyltransferase [Candidatus Neomarinimicrobiota bacterium]